MLPWNRLKTEIMSITDENPSLTPYQSWDYLNYTGKGFTARHPQKMLGLRSMTFCLYRGDQVVTIAPLLQQGNTLCLRGQYTGAGNLDLIYRPDFSYEEFSFLMDAIRKRCGKAQWTVDRVSEKSLLLDYWQRYTAQFPDVSVTKETCVEIMMQESYDAWYHSLSKSVRQNLRTSYNRANTDNKQIDVRIRYDCPIPAHDFQEILQVASK